MKKLKNRILVAPLNWGLGHAARCIPIINALIKHSFTPIIASDGNALKLLEKEFPELEIIELPSYNIEYSKKGKYLKLKLLKDSPKILKAISKEKRVIKKLVEEGKIDGIISDNRFGIYNKKIPSVFITHQLQVMSGNSTWLTTKVHTEIISKYDECWVPDSPDTINLSGDLGHTKTINTPLKYLGVLSRFKKEARKIEYDLMVLLSGPEPQRTFLEELLFKELTGFMGKVLFVKGIVEKEQKFFVKANILVYNFMTSKQLQNALNESELVLSRSGYTTIMDLATLEKKAFFIPTPGQLEQEYLASRLTDLNLVPSCKQENFALEKLKNIDNYKGLIAFEAEVDYEKLFSLFKSE